MNLLGGVSDKQVYRLVDNGRADKVLIKVALKDVPLLERIKNVFGFGSINLERIVTYCLKKESVICWFDDRQELSNFVSTTKNDSRMRDEKNSSNVLSKLKILESRIKGMGYQLPTTANANSLAHITIDPDTKERPEYGIPYHIRGAKSGRYYGAKPEDRLPQPLSLETKIENTKAAMGRIRTILEAPQYSAEASLLNALKGELHYLERELEYLERVAETKKTWTGWDS